MDFQGFLSVGFSAGESCYGLGLLRLHPLNDNCVTPEFDPLLTSGSKPPSSKAFLVDDLCS